MKVLITGASGFIGQNLVKNLSEKFEVTPISLRNENWESSLHESDIIINLVGKAHDHKGKATDEDYIFANVTLVKQIFEAFQTSEAKLFIHISSLAAIEEFESKKPLTEDQECHPISIYARTKREAEKWLLDQKMPPNKKLIILRPPMVHGPGDKGNLKLLYKFVSKGVPYPLSSFANNRSFLSIDNFSFFITQIAVQVDDLQPGIYHIADDESLSTMQIINCINNLQNKNMIILNIPKKLITALAKIGDYLPVPINTKKLKKLTSDLLLSNAKIKNALGIEKLPLTALQGLELTLKSFANKR